MNELRQAAEQALEALRYTTDHLPAKTGVERHVDDAITALQVALAQPEWVGLTDEEVIKCFDSVAFGQVEDDLIINKHVNIFRAIHGIEAKLKEKNTRTYG